MPPALVVLADASTDPDQLGAALDTARRVPGVARVLLFHPAEIENDLARRSLGFRLWPQEGDSAGQRFANAFRQAADLGYEGAVVLAPDDPCLDPDVITEAVGSLAEHRGAVKRDGNGGVSLLGLHEPADALLAGDGIPSYDEILRRAEQLRVRLVELS